MSEFGGLLGNLTPVAHNPAQDAAAVRAVLWRVDTGQIDRAGARRILEALGLVASPPPPRKPRVRTQQVVERDPGTKRFLSPQVAGDRLTHPDPPATHENPAAEPLEAKAGHHSVERGDGPART